MNHEAVQERFSSYLDGDLPIEERAELEAHLDGCGECREELELLRVTLDTLHDLPVVPAPDGFAATLLEQIPDGDTAAGDGTGDVVVPLRRKGPSALVWAPIAMAAAAGVVIGVVWWQLPRITGHGPGAADQAAPVMFAEAEEVAPAVPPDGSATGRWVDERAKLKREPPAAEQSDLDGLTDVSGEDEENKTALLPSPRGATGAGDPNLARGAMANEEFKIAEKSGRTSVSHDPPAEPDAGEGQAGAYYSDWERREGAETTASDAVADLGYDGRGDDGFAPAPPAVTVVGGQIPAQDGEDGVVDLDLGGSRGRSMELGAGEKGDEFGFGAAGADQYDRTTADTSRREVERMRKEEEAYRRLYDAEDDAVVDTAAIMTDEVEEDEWTEAEFLEERPVTPIDAEPASTVASKSSNGGRGGVLSKKGGGSRTREDRNSGRRGKAKDNDKVTSPNRDQRAAPGQSMDFDDDVSDVAVAPGANQAMSQTEAAAEPTAIGSAEWTLQTTEATTPYAISELCDEVFSLRCTWGAPGHRPTSLGAQDNYQVVEFHILGAEYASVQTRLRQYGSVLVRSEDIGMSDASDPITVRLIIEYMP